MSLKKRTVDWMYLAYDRDQWWAMIIQVPLRQEIF
jgi:hypothetical protein